MRRCAVIWSAFAPLTIGVARLPEMGDNLFDSAQLTVKVGTTVTWTVVGQSTHDLAARDGSFVNRTMSFGQTFSFTSAGPVPSGTSACNTRGTG